MPATPRIRLSPRLRRAVLTVHIIASVGLLGDVAAMLAIHVWAASSDLATALVAYDLLEIFPMVFGIPLSVIALASGVVLGLGSMWGVLRYAWVVGKLGLLVSVVLVGALVIGPALESAQTGAQRTALLIGAAGYDVLALTAATILSVFKPRRPAPARARATAVSASRA